MNNIANAVHSSVSAEPHTFTVLLATDFLQSSRLALDYAAAFAHRLNARLVIVNAFELTAIAETVEAVDHVQSRTRLNAEARLKAFAASTSVTGVPTKWALVEGLLPNAILDAVKKYSADLLVMGTQGVHRGLSHLLIGSNTEAIMQKAPCPTVTIGPHVLGGVAPQMQFSRAVYISDPNRPCIASKPIALQIGSQLARNIEVRQFATDEVRKNPAQAKQLAANFSESMRCQIPDLDWSDPDYQLSRLITPQQLLELSADPSILMVLGVRPESYFGRHIRTCTAYKLLAEAACPILTVRDE